MISTKILTLMTIMRVHGYTYQEIADECGVSLKSAHTHLHLIRVRMDRPEYMNEAIPTQPKIAPAISDAMIQRREAGATYNQIATEFNISVSKSWRHLRSAKLPFRHLNAPIVP